jgi:hypothetical protein
VPSSIDALVRSLRAGSQPELCLAYGNRIPGSRMPAASRVSPFASLFPHWLAITAYLTVCGQDFEYLGQSVLYILDSAHPSDLRQQGRLEAVHFRMRKC